MTTWAHLPNAALVDEVLASIKTSPEKWGAAQIAVWGVTRDAPQDAAWTAVWGTTWDTAWAAVRAAARTAAWLAARDATWGVAGGAARNTAAAWSAVATLIAYDDAGQFMKLPAEHLQRLYRIEPHPMFLLLQPAAIVFTEQVTTP